MLLSSVACCATPSSSAPDESRLVTSRWEGSNRIALVFGNHAEPDNDPDASLRYADQIILLDRASGALAPRAIVVLGVRPDGIAVYRPEPFAAMTNERDARPGGLTEFAWYDAAAADRLRRAYDTGDEPLKIVLLDVDGDVIIQSTTGLTSEQILQAFDTE